MMNDELKNRYLLFFEWPWSQSSGLPPPITHQVNPSHHSIIPFFHHSTFIIQISSFDIHPSFFPRIFRILQN